MNLFSVEARRDPYPLYRQLRERTPVLHVPGPNLWIVLRHAAVKRVLTDHEAFSSNVSALHGHDFAWLLFMDPPRHTKLRVIISKSFTSRAIAALEPRIRELSRQLLDVAVARGQLDLVANYATPLPLMVVALGNTISGAGAAEAADWRLGRRSRPTARRVARTELDGHLSTRPCSLELLPSRWPHRESRDEPKTIGPLTPEYASLDTTLSATTAITGAR